MKIENWKVALVKAYGPAEHYKLDRDEDRDVEFKGWELGSDNDDAGTGRTLRVTIYATTGGNYVILEHQGTCWDGEHDVDVVRVVDRNACGSDPEMGSHVLGALRDLCDGELGRISKRAWSEACENDPVLRAAECETIA